VLADLLAAIQVLFRRIRETREAVRLDIPLHHIAFNIEDEARRLLDHTMATGIRFDVKRSEVEDAD
jgi:hypothetical protein